MANSKRRDFLAATLQSNVAECINWPFAVRKSSGYPAHSLIHEEGGKKNVDAHRYMCEMAHGPSSPGEQAAHKCGNKICVNPAHLYWADPITNAADSIAHGTLRGGGLYRQRIFEDDIRFICTSGKSLIELGSIYGMEAAYIGRVRRSNCDRYAG